MNKLLIKTSVFVSLFLASLSPAYADNWRLDKDENDIQIYTRAVQGSAIREVKGELMVASSLDSVLAVFDDIPSFPRWNHQSTKSIPLQRVSAIERYHYQNINMPFPVKDRDLLIHSKITQARSAVFVHLNLVADYCKQSLVEECEAINQSKNVMVTRFKGEYKLEPQKEGGLKITWIEHTEPAGKLPNWLVNSMLIDVPFNTLNKLRQRIKEKKYQQAKLKRDDSGRILGF